MTGKPSYRLMARSGVPVAKLLIAQRQAAGPSPATMIEYAVAVAAIFGMVAVFWWLGATVLEALPAIR